MQFFLQQATDTIMLKGVYFILRIMNKNKNDYANDESSDLCIITMSFKWKSINNNYSLTFAQ